MNIIIPLGGKGERFVKNGYIQPKPLIPIFEKCMIEYVLDNLKISINDKIFIIYNLKLDDYNFYNIIINKYPYINLIPISDTKGAAETLYVGIQSILNNYNYNKKCLILDCDTFYTEDIIKFVKETEDNIVFYTINKDIDPIYSYIELNNDSLITKIKEKEKISNNANTGAYVFNDIQILHEYCKYVIDNNITINNEPYTSCVISEMITHNIMFKGYKLNDKYVFSLGTPVDVEKYINNTFAFLFDLDGTIIITDDIYIDVWYEILIKYNIILTKELFIQFIQGNNDKYVLNTLLKNINISLAELSNIKDELFIKNIDKIKIVDGIYNLINNIKLKGYKICIVTNCNKLVADKIATHININFLIDFIISSNDCINGKPDGEPYKKAINKYNINNDNCFIFEDSKTGILSGKCNNPKLIIGIETNYTNTELLNYGVHFSICNFNAVDINCLIDYTIKTELITNIKNNSLITNIKEICINTNKLKGGFIADIISFNIIDFFNCTYSQILKYENTNINDLSIMAKQ